MTYEAKLARTTAERIIKSRSSAFISAQSEEALRNLNRYFTRTDPQKEPEDYRAAYDALLMLRETLGTPQVTSYIGRRLFNSATTTLAKIIGKRPEEKLSQLSEAWKTDQTLIELPTLHGKKRIVKGCLMFAEVQYECTAVTNPLKPVLRPFELVLDVLDNAHANHARLEEIAAEVKATKRQYPADYVAFSARPEGELITVRAYLVKPAVKNQ